MGWEYQLNYLTTKSLSNTELDSLQNSLTRFIHESLKIEVLKTENEVYEYGFKFSEVADHDWIWDGHLYLKKDKGLLVFQLGNHRHIDFTIQFLKNLFSENLIEIKLEEL